MVHYLHRLDFIQRHHIKGERFSGKENKRLRAGYAKVTKFQALNINGEFWYPTLMVAYFLSKNHKSASIYKARHLISNYLSDAVIKRHKTRPDFRSAFSKIDGHWFTTEDKFNTMWKNRGHQIIKFKPEIVIIK